MPQLLTMSRAGDAVVNTGMRLRCLGWLSGRSSGVRHMPWHDGLYRSEGAIREPTNAFGSGSLASPLPPCRGT